ncbi:MAG: UDP-N-acetylmuramate dehydrogenase [Ginsengibacter sp.]
MLRFKSNVSLINYNTFHINALAKLFTNFCSAAELIQILGSMPDNSRLLVIGGGSNILLTEDFDGLVLKNEIPGIEIVSEDEKFIYVKAGAGVNWHHLVMYCVENNFGGVENLSLIPGNVGASPMQNIGAYGVEIKDVFHRLEAIRLADKKAIAFSTEDCEFGYRESVFKKKFKGQFIICNVTYKLRKTPILNTSYGAINAELKKFSGKDLSIKVVSDAVINIRQSKLPDPSELGNAGSFFKNPEVNKSDLEKLKKLAPDVPFFSIDENKYKVPAGWLIEQCGWKGFRKGDAGCYEKQALVLVNYGGASGKEIFELSEVILQSVFAKFQIHLEREINVI